MTKFYFDLAEDGRSVPDQVGQEMPGSKNAKIEACRAAAEIAADMFSRKSEGMIEVTIRDGDHAIARARVSFDCKDL